MIDEGAEPPDIGGWPPLSLSGSNPILGTIAPGYEIGHVATRQICFAKPPHNSCLRQTHRGWRCVERLRRLGGCQILEGCQPERLPRQRLKRFFESIDERPKSLAEELETLCPLDRYAFYSHSQESPLRRRATLSAKLSSCVAPELGSLSAS
jgi:hypothetical protein